MPIIFNLHYIKLSIELPTVWYVVKDFILVVGQADIGKTKIKWTVEPLHITLQKHSSQIEWVNIMLSVGKKRLVDTSEFHLFPNDLLLPIVILMLPFSKVLILSRNNFCHRRIEIAAQPDRFVSRWLCGVSKTVQKLLQFPMQEKSFEQSILWNHSFPVMPIQIWTF